uniref:Uncharacterized protein n=1 Tax=Anguilla anguilla TaxID=7936 RepID=A0A0E9XK72_ANGAN
MFLPCVFPPESSSPCVSAHVLFSTCFWIFGFSLFPEFCRVTLCFFEELPCEAFCSLLSWIS